MKKVEDLTVKELISLGRKNNVHNLRIVIDGSDKENKLFDVEICGTGYGWKLMLEDVVEE